ncbi:MAG TPA: hypothetical protein VMO26_10000 [Vicinamibacterales bacterium]|nr:hypothetical protein [Vicinamibacterales bacterium]
MFSAVLLLAASPVSGQTRRPERPYRGLFASGTEAAEQSLTANVSLAGGYDDNLRASAGSGGGGGGARAAAGSQGGVLGQLTGALAYSRQSDSFTLSASAQSGTRYYPSTEVNFIASSQAQVALTARLFSRTSLSARAGAVRQPDTFASLFTGAAVPTIDEMAPVDLDTLSSFDYYLAYDGALSLQQDVGRRTKVGAIYGYRRTTGRGERGEFVHQRGGGQITHQLGRGLALRAGYTYGEVKHADGARIPNHLIDAGVNYNRSLSFSRRTTLSFGTGTAATHTHDRLRYSLIGDARLNHEIGRTWTAFAAYSRRVLLHESWQEPVFADAVTAGFGGLINRRWELTTTASAALGTVGVDTGGKRFDTYQGSAALTYSLVRYMNVGLTYAYYHYEADASVVLPAGFPRAFGRQSLRATVNLWAPLYQRARRTNASR